jgi:hypothetical protein
MDPNLEFRRLTIPSEISPKTKEVFKRLEEAAKHGLILSAVVNVVSLRTLGSMAENRLKAGNC